MESVLPVLVDSGQIEQLLMNLVTNAHDAMPEGGMVVITTDNVEMDEEFRKGHGFGEPGRYALLTFADNGVGMDAQTQQRIFEPFFTTKEVGKGTGLGLSVVYGIVKQHNDYINCYSEPGKGTTFRIYLPLQQEAAERASVTTAVLPAGGTETILVAEDDPTVRSLVRGILEELGYTVIEAQNGEEAVAKFRQRQKEIGLCLLDVIMPKMKGVEALAEIRRMSPDVRVMFMSGYQADALLLDGVTGKEVEIIAKPVLPRELLRRVREMLDG